MSAVDDYLRALFGLEGKSAVVLGGTGVLCGRMAEALAAAGAFVYVAGRNVDKGIERVQAIERGGGKAEFWNADVADRGSLLALLDHITHAGRGVDVLVNGAGVNSAVPYFDIRDQDWQRILDVNLSGLHRACQIFGRHMTARGRGSIVNVASVSAETPLSKVFAYSASKAAVVNYTQNLARELAPFGVRVNALSPGFFPAEQNRAILDADRTEKVMGRTPLARFGEPNELDGALLLLASERAGGFLTGANLIVDGGFSATSI